MHVAWAQNELADYTGHLAEQQEHDVGLEDLAHAVIDYFHLNHAVFFSIANEVDSDALMAKPCSICAQVGNPDSTLVCDYC